MTRTELLLAIAEALRAGVPSRADALIGALAARLSGGPWTLALGLTRAPPAIDLPFDALIAETARAVRRDVDVGEARFRRLERWTADSLRERATALLSDVIVSGSEAFISWAGDALECGVDTPSIRVLAGLQPEDASHEHRGWQWYVHRAFEELSWTWPAGDDAELANLREYAKQVALFAITPDSAARACSRLEAATAQGRRLYERAAWLDYGDDLPAHTVAATRDIADFWREILATTPDPDE